MKSYGQTHRPSKLQVKARGFVRRATEKPKGLQKLKTKTGRLAYRACVRSPARLALRVRLPVPGRLPPGDTFRFWTCKIFQKYIRRAPHVACPSVSRVPVRSPTRAQPAGDRNVAVSTRRSRYRYGEVRGFALYFFNAVRMRHSGTSSDRYSCPFALPR